jgi:uncharacterized membrane protein
MAPRIPGGDRRPLVDPFGLALAGLFFAAALTPSLIPRDPVGQGALAGTVAGVGYLIGALAGLFWRFLELPELRGRWRLRGRLAGYGVGLGLAALALGQADDAQNATRRVFGLEPVDTGHGWTIAGAGAAVFLVLWLAGKLFAVLSDRLSGRLERILPRRIGAAIGFGLALFLFWSLIDGVLLRRGIEIADASFEAADAFISPDIPPPAEPMRTGSTASLIEWQEIGRHGRNFIATAPTRAEIAAFAGPGAMDPVRVYVGRRSGETAQERADLALAELIRAGGFDRSVLVVVVPVGTGWMDPGGHDTLDFILGGDVATVAVQYSYLTSVLSLWVHPEYGLEQARVLFDTIYGHWTSLPRDSRPRLFVHGLSQGAFNSQTTLPLLDMLADPIDGGMWAGSPFFSPFWRRVREGRLPDSPAWRPRFGNGSFVRSANQFGGLEEAAAPWGPIRFVFLNYGSDPIVVFNSGSAWAPPDWMRRPRAPDVADELRWFPVVTTFQLALDMAISLRVPGFGHAYIARDYIPAWAAVLDPPGWSAEREAALRAIFETRPGPFD